MGDTIRVTHYHRRPMAQNHSIERLFADIRGAMEPPFECRPAVCRFESRGILPRVYNILEAVARQSDVNHVTGDIHYVSLFLRRPRTVLTIHDCASLERLSGSKRFLFWLFWIALPLRRVSLVTVVSEKSKEELLRHATIDPGKIRVVPNCVSAVFGPTPRPRRARPVLLQVGTGANKNIVRLAQALRHIECELRIVGRLFDEQERALADAGVRYSALPDLSDREVARAYEDADAVVFVSTYEGFGLPVLEAQAAGRPVVTSGIEPMLGVAGGAACFVDPLDVESIRAGVLRVLSDAAYGDELVARGLENARRFTPAAVARRYAEIYDELLGGGTFGSERTVV